MEPSAINNETLELSSNLNQGTLSRYSVKYLLPIFLIPPITGDDPFQFDYTEGQIASQSDKFVAQSKSELSEDFKEPLQIDFHEMSQSTFDIEMGNLSSVSEDYDLLENFVVDILDNSVHLPGELNKLIYENIDDLLI